MGSGTKKKSWLTWSLVSFMFRTWSGPAPRDGRGCRPGLVLGIIIALGLRVGLEMVEVWAWSWA